MAIFNDVLDAVSQVAGDVAPVPGAVEMGFDEVEGHIRIDGKMIEAPGSVDVCGDEFRGDIGVL